MVIAYILIKTLTGHEQEVSDKLAYIPEVYEVNTLNGEYSIITKIVAENYEKLGKITMDNIRKIDNIVTLEILPVIDTTNMIEVIEGPIKNVL
jgi:DNA-binding Lrp family transcriptional regulator